MNALRTLRQIANDWTPIITMLLIVIGILLAGPAAVFAR